MAIVALPLQKSVMEATDLQWPKSFGGKTVKEAEELQRIRPLEGRPRLSAWLACPCAVTLTTGGRWSQSCEERPERGADAEHVQVTRDVSWQCCRVLHRDRTRCVPSISRPTHQSSHQVCLRWLLALASLFLYPIVSAAVGGAAPQFAFFGGERSLDQFPAASFVALESPPPTSKDAHTLHTIDHSTVFITCVASKNRLSLVGRRCCRTWCAAGLPVTGDQGNLLRGPSTR